MYQNSLIEMPLNCSEEGNSNKLYKNRKSYPLLKLYCCLQERCLLPVAIFFDFLAAELFVDRAASRGVNSPTH